MYQLCKSLWRISNSIETSLFRGRGGKKGGQERPKLPFWLWKGFYTIHITHWKKILRSWGRFHRSLKHYEFMKNEFNRQSWDQEELFYITKKFSATLLKSLLKRSIYFKGLTRCIRSYQRHMIWKESLSRTVPACCSCNCDINAMLTNILCICGLIFI